MCNTVTNAVTGGVTNAVANKRRRSSRPDQTREVLKTARGLFGDSSHSSLQSVDGPRTAADHRLVAASLMNEANR